MANAQHLFEKHIEPVIFQNVNSLFEELENNVQSQCEALDPFLKGVLSNLVKFEKPGNVEEYTEDKTGDTEEDDVFNKPVNEPPKKRGRHKKTLNLEEGNIKNSSDERARSNSEENEKRPTEESTADTVFVIPCEPQKKRGRPKHTLNGSVKVSSSDSDVGSAEEGSSRARRAAAQAADQKRAETDTFMNATKLRRPTDFDIKQAKSNLSLPREKTRKTCIEQSTMGINITDDNHDEQNKDQIVASKETPPPSSSGTSDVECVNESCYVRLEKLSTASTSTKRKSDDLFNDSPTFEDTQETGGKSKKKGKTSSIPSVVLVQDISVPAAHMQDSPIAILSSPSPPVLNGQSVQVIANNTKQLRKKTFVSSKDIKLEVTEEIEQKTITLSQKEENSNTATSLRSRKTVLKKTYNNMSQQEIVSEIMESDKENNQQNDKTFIVEREPSPNPRSKTKKNKRGPIMISSQSDEEAKDEQAIETFEDCDNIPLKVPSVKDRVPSPVKGQLVKKTVEVFEKMRVNENPTTTRVTRAKNKALETHRTTNRLGNPPGSSVRTTSAESHRRLTPLSGNRVTPSIPVSSKNQKRDPSPSTRNASAHTVCTTTVIRDDDDKRKKKLALKMQQTKEEEERKKKLAERAKKDEDKKRRKEEHRQKVAASREAVEKEKAQLAAKAEKEKEEKLQQLAAEKEKLREEELQKKKLLQQQRALEHEDRRKQEEAARLAKLKEQEQEHKRIIAAKEREKELKKQQKAAETQLSKIDKTKTVVTKTVGISSQNKNQNPPPVNTPQASVAQESTQSYEVTPARDERPLLPSKTENDYGIDDANSSDSSEDEAQPKKQIPHWAQPKNRFRKVQVDHYVPQEEKRLFMERNPKPDLMEIFAGCKFRTRARTSSAVWNTPPRFFNNDNTKKQ